jgi:glycosyltransferase involved in cell wall biosynthesis
VSISIVLYCYKNKDYLEQTLVTLINQTIVDWEAVVINDGFSYFPESSVPADKLHQFRIINLKQPVGMARAYLMGLVLARKKTCVFLRGYDFQAIDRLQYQQFLLANTSVDFVFNIPRSFSEKGVQIEEELKRLCDQKLISGTAIFELIVQKALPRSSFYLSSFMFKISSLAFMNARDLLGDEIKPKRLQSEFILLNAFLRRNSLIGLCDSKQLVTINCKKDINIYEEDDYEDWQKKEKV